MYLLLSSPSTTFQIPLRSLSARYTNENVSKMELEEKIRNKDIGRRKQLDGNDGADSLTLSFLAAETKKNP